jgi:hypothetical protein
MIGEKKMRSPDGLRTLRVTFQALDQRTVSQPH